MTSVKCSWWCSSRFTGQERGAPFLTRQKRMLSQPHDTILKITNTPPFSEDHYPYPPWHQILLLILFVYVLLLILGTRLLIPVRRSKIWAPAVIKSSHPHSFNIDVSVSPSQHTHLTRASDSGCVPHDH